MQISIKGACLSALALTFVAVGCGGDDGGGDVTPKDSGVDASTNDGGDASADASTNADASADELAAALETAGVNVTPRRADLVFPVACRQIFACGFTEDEDFTTEQGCATEGRAAWANGMASGYSAACLDAVLDLYACTATNEACDLEMCTDVFDARDTACAPYVGDAGM